MLQPFGLGGVQRNPGGHPHVYSVGKGLGGVKVGFVVKVGHNRMELIEMISVWVTVAPISNTVLPS